MQRTTTKVRTGTKTPEAIALRFHRANRRAEMATLNAERRGTLRSVEAARKAHLNAARLADNRWIDGRYVRLHRTAAAFWWKRAKQLKKELRAIRG